MTGRVIVEQDPEKRRQVARDIGRELATSPKSAGDQLGIAMTHALMSGMAKTLAEQLREVTMSDGPWVLHPDGTVTEP